MKLTDNTHEMTTVHQPRSLEYVLVLPVPLLCIRRGWVGPRPLLVNLQHRLRDIIMVPREYYQRCRWGRGEEEETFFVEGVGVEETVSWRLCHGLCIGLRGCGRRGG